MKRILGLPVLPALIPGSGRHCSCDDDRSVACRQAGMTGFFFRKNMVSSLRYVKIIMKQSQKTLLSIIVPIILVVGGLVFIAKNNQAGGSEYDSFAQCLTEKGTTYYGAYWCPNCQNQNKLFGSAKEHVDYVECGVPGNRSQQSKVCKDAGIEAYPTWEFSDGSRVTGTQSLSKLAGKTGCELPTL